MIGCAIGFSQGAQARPAGCAQAVINDWAQGGLDQPHSPACYRQALAALPEDVRVYSSAPDDIRRALAVSVAGTARAVRKLAGVQRAQSASPDRSPEAGSGVPVPALLAASLALALVGLGATAIVVRRRLGR